jgi:hypothetical protein
VRQMSRHRDMSAVLGLGTVWVLRLYAPAQVSKAMRMVQGHREVRVVRRSGKAYIPLRQFRLLATHLCDGLAESPQSYLCGRANWGAVAISSHP